MNGKRRTALREALSMLSRVVVIVDGVCDEEYDAVDNYPENLQATDRFEEMENAVENLTEAVEKIAEAKEYIDKVMK